MDIEKVKAARKIINQLANGVNPLDNSPLPESDIVNNVHLSRCLFFVSDVLRKVIEEEKGLSKKASKKLPFAISYTQLLAYKYSSHPIALSKVIQRINDLIDVSQMEKLSFNKVANWLVGSGFLQLQVGEDGKKTRRPTKAGTDIGIAVERKAKDNREYMVVVYNRSAQQFILDNLEGMLEDIPQPQPPILNKNKRSPLDLTNGIDIFV